MEFILQASASNLKTHPPIELQSARSAWNPTEQGTKPSKPHRLYDIMQTEILRLQTPNPQLILQEPLLRRELRRSLGFRVKALGRI